MKAPFPYWVSIPAAAVVAASITVAALFATPVAGATLQDDEFGFGGDAFGTSEAYDRLANALGRYEEIADRGGWGTLPAKFPAKGRRRADFVVALRSRLAAEGDLDYDDGSPDFDEALSEAVRRFQERHGLKVDGKLNAKTIERMNVPASERVSQIKLNMQRHQAMRDIPPTRVEVNAPAATATLFRDGLTQLEMNAVVGAPGHDTPTLSSEITTIIVNPTWTIPKSIIEKEIRPLLKKDPDYLTKNRMNWVGDQLVQEPGSHNALGHIKFEFPNKYSVYLHDTPAKKLFLNPERAESHGCVRLERPLDLAEELLRDDPSWNREALENAIAQGATQRITLNEPMPVVITYITAFVTDAGVVNFRPDIYGLDAQLKLAGSQEPAPAESAP